MNQPNMNIDQIVKAVVAELGRVPAGVPATEKAAPVVGHSAQTFSRPAQAATPPASTASANAPQPGNVAAPSVAGGESLPDIGERAYKKQCGVKAAHKPEVLAV